MRSWKNTKTRGDVLRVFSWEKGRRMKEFAAEFYKSKVWQRCRDDYMNHAGGICEECLARGIYRPAEIVHHLIEITPENIQDPKVTLNWDNLEAVCRECHAEKHGARVRRYKIGGDGKVVATR